MDDDQRPRRWKSSFGRRQELEPDGDDERRAAACSNARSSRERRTAARSSSAARSRCRRRWRLKMRRRPETVPSQREDEVDVRTIAEPREVVLDDVPERVRRQQERHVGGELTAPGARAERPEQLDACAPVARGGAGSGARDGAQRARQRSWTRCGRRPRQSSAGTLELEAEHLGQRGTRGGRTSSTVSGRPSSRAIVVNAASSSPQAVIHSVNGAGSRSTFSA